MSLVWTLASRNLFQDRLLFVATLIGIVFSVVLVMVQMEFSGGEQQRVAIARAVVAEPLLVLADEPTAALDSVSGKAVVGILAAIAKKQGRAVLVVSHDGA